MSKRELLREICETPGWQPDSGAPVDEGDLAELQAEGWIVPRLDGWEATAGALEAYPHFTLDEEGRVKADEWYKRPEPAERKCVPIERVVAMLVGMLRFIPVGSVYALASNPPTAYPKDGPEWEIAQKVAERMASD